METVYRGRVSAFPSNGPLTFERKAVKDYDNELEPDGNGHACISDILIHDNINSELDEHLIVYGGVTLVRNRAKTRYGDFVEGGNLNVGKRGPVTDFSNKSRRNMMVTMAKMDDPFEVWQDFTFADDIMEGKTIKEKAKLASYCLWKLKHWSVRYGLEINGVWKKEWQKRKSGALKGHYVPHYHMVYSVPNADQDMYNLIIKKLAVRWVKITGTQLQDKALAVALHHKSSRLIQSRKQMQIYMSKYIVKHDGFVTDESIGRNWGKVGDPREGEGLQIEMTTKDMVLLKRCLRKLVKKRRKHFGTMLKTQYNKFFIFIEKRTIDKIIKYIDMAQGVEGVPF
ncbi:MAG: hypothetical protein NT140_11475 [Deltaproteobacteria bacterium]|nr:hypothetical protein [Deltaproteobacteria bacterium]